MKIQQVSAYRVGEMVFATIAEAQKRELIDLIAGDKLATDREVEVAQWIVDHTDDVVAILTCTPKAAPRKPRSDIGKKRAANDSTPAVL